MDPNELDQYNSDAAQAWQDAGVPVTAAPAPSAPPVRDDWAQPQTWAPAQTQDTAPWNPDVQPNQDNTDPLSNAGISWAVAARDAVAPGETAHPLPQTAVRQLQSTWDQSQAAADAAVAQANADADTRAQAANDQANQYVQDAAPYATPGTGSSGLSQQEIDARWQRYIDSENEAAKRAADAGNSFSPEAQTQDTASSDAIANAGQGNDWIRQNLPGYAGATDALGSAVDTAKTGLGNVMQWSWQHGMEPTLGGLATPGLALRIQQIESGSQPEDYPGQLQELRDLMQPGYTGPEDITKPEQLGQEWDQLAKRWENLPAAFPREAQPAIAAGQFALPFFLPGEMWGRADPVFGWGGHALEGASNLARFGTADPVEAAVRAEQAANAATSGARTPTTMQQMSSRIPIVRRMFSPDAETAVRSIQEGAAADAARVQRMHAEAQAGLERNGQFPEWYTGQTAEEANAAGETSPAAGQMARDLLPPEYQTPNGSPLALPEPGQAALGERYGLTEPPAPYKGGPIAAGAPAVPEQLSSAFDLHTTPAPGLASMAPDDVVSHLEALDARHAANDARIQEIENQIGGGTLPGTRGASAVVRPPWAAGITNDALQQIAKDHGTTASSPLWWEKVGLDTGSGEVREQVGQGNYRSGFQSQQNPADARAELARLQAEQAQIEAATEHIWSAAEQNAQLYRAESKASTEPLPWEYNVRDNAAAAEPARVETSAARPENPPTSTGRSRAPARQPATSEPSHQPATPAAEPAPVTPPGALGPIRSGDDVLKAGDYLDQQRATLQKMVNDQYEAAREKAAGARGAGARDAVYQDRNNRLVATYDAGRQVLNEVADYIEQGAKAAGVQVPTDVLEGYRQLAALAGEASKRGREFANQYWSEVRAWQRGDRTGNAHPFNYGDWARGMQQIWQPANRAMEDAYEALKGGWSDYRNSVVEGKNAQIADLQRQVSTKAPVSTQRGTAASVEHAQTARPNGPMTELEAETLAQHAALEDNGIKGFNRPNYSSDVLKDINDLENGGFSGALRPDSQRLLTDRGIHPDQMQPVDQARALRDIIKNDRDAAFRAKLNSDQKIIRDGDRIANANGLPSVVDARRAANANTGDLTARLLRPTGAAELDQWLQEAHDRHMGNIAPGTKPETQAALSRAASTAKARDPLWDMRPNAGRPGHTDVPLPADLMASRVTRAVADIAAEHNGYPNAVAWTRAQPGTAIAKLGKIYDNTQRVLIEHMLATPQFLKHVLLSNSVLGGLHGIAPWGRNPEAVRAAFPQLREGFLQHGGMSAGMAGEGAGVRASQTRRMYNALDNLASKKVHPVAGLPFRVLRSVDANLVEAIPRVTHAQEARIKAAAFERYFPQATAKAIRGTAAEEAVGKMIAPEPGLSRAAALNIQGRLHGAEGAQSITRAFSRARAEAGNNPAALQAVERWENRAQDAMQHMSPDAKQALDRAQTIGSRASEHLTHRWMIDRSNPTVLDRYMQRVFPFWHYDSQNPLIWARTAADNPKLIGGVAQYLTAAHEAQNPNAPDRMRGYYPIGTALSGLGLNHDNGWGVNPLRGLGFYKFLNPTNFQAREGVKTGEPDNQIGGALGDFEGAGLTPSPLLSLIANQARRAAGEHPDARDLLPQSTWARYISAQMTGHPFDVEAPLKNLLYGTSQDKSYDYEVQKQMLAQMMRGEKPDLDTAHRTAGDIMRTQSMFGMFKHESPEEQQYIDLAKQRRDLKTSGGDVKAFDKAHPELFPWFDKNYGGTPEDFLAKEDQRGAKSDYYAQRNDIFASKTGKDRSDALAALDAAHPDIAGQRTAAAGTKAAAGTTPQTDKQHVAGLFGQYSAIPEDDKVGRARFMLDHAQELRDHGFAMKQTDDELKRSYWSTVAKEAGAHGDKDALSEAVAQLSALKGVEPPKVALTDAERTRSKELSEQLDALTTSKEKAAFFNEHRDEMRALGWNVQDAKPYTPSTSTRRPFVPRGSFVRRGYTRSPSSGYSRSGYSPQQNSDRSAWAQHWSEYAAQPDAKAKAQYLLDHYDEINAIAGRIGKEPIRSSQTQLDSQARGGKAEMPAGAPPAGSPVQEQTAWLGKQQARLDSLVRVKDAAVAAQGSDPGAINSLGALVDQHRTLFGEDLEGKSPDDIAHLMIPAQGDINQAKAHWSANGNGPHDAIGHIFDEYNNRKNSGDHLGAARYLDSHWDELISLGYQPKFPRPNIAALEARQAGTGQQTTPGVTGQQVSAPGYARGQRNVDSTTKTLVFDRDKIPLDQRANYRVDHVIPLTLGGTNDASNLRAQPAAEAKQKDVVEAYLHTEVRYGRMALEDAQTAIRDNWQGVYASIPARTRVRIASQLASADGQPAPDVETHQAPLAPQARLPWLPAPRSQRAPRVTSYGRPRAPFVPRTTGGTINAPGSIPASSSRRFGGAPAAARPPVRWMPAPIGRVAVSRPQPLHYWQPRPARSYNVPTERRSRGQVSG